MPRILFRHPASDLNETANLVRVDRTQIEAGTAASRPIAGIGRVLLWSGGSLWIGRDAGLGDSHAHHAIQIALALDSQFRMAAGNDDWREHRGAIVMPHRRHRFDGCGQRMAMIFVEPETAQGRALLARCTDADITDLDIATADALAAPLRTGYLAVAANDVLIAISQDVVAALAGSVPPQAASTRASAAPSLGCARGSIRRCR